MGIRYLVVTVNDGGADFESYDKWSDVPFSVDRWNNADGGVAIRDELKRSELGDEINLDGCSTCYVLKANNQ
jgi:hypothetical protein